MALKTLFGKGSSSAVKGDYVVANKLNEGETVEGYLMGYGTNSFELKTGKRIDKRVMLLRTKAGEDIKLSMDGNLKYVEQDADKRGITMGALTVITRTGTKTTNFGPSGLFSVAQDMEDTVDVQVDAAAPAADAAVSSTTSSVEEKIARLKKNAAAVK